MHLNWCRTPFIRARGESDSSLYLQDILACAICFGVNVSRRTGRNMTKLIRLCQSGFLFFLHSSLNLHADNQSGGQLLWSLRSLHQLMSLLFAPIVHWVSPTSTTRFRAQTMLSGRSSFSWVAQSMSGCSCICINRSNQVSTLTSTDTVRQAMPVLGIFKLTRYLSLSAQATPSVVISGKQYNKPGSPALSPDFLKDRSKYLRGIEGCTIQQLHVNIYCKGGDMS
jgi:hypothetical protein